MLWAATEVDAHLPSNLRRWGEDHPFGAFDASPAEYPWCHIGGFAFREPPSSDGSCVRQEQRAYSKARGAAPRALRDGAACWAGRATDVGPRAWPLSQPTMTLHGEHSHENHDSNDADDVRHPGKRTCGVVRVCPDETDDRPHDEQGDHRDQPVENPSGGDALKSYSRPGVAPTP
jgi:hypothetical protein